MSCVCVLRLCVSMLSVFRFLLFHGCYWGWLGQDSVLFFVFCLGTPERLPWAVDTCVLCVFVSYYSSFFLFLSTAVFLLFSFFYLQQQKQHKAVTKKETRPATRCSVRSVIDQEKLEIIEVVKGLFSLLWSDYLLKIALFYVFCVLWFSLVILVYFIVDISLVRVKILHFLCGLLFSLGFVCPSLEYCLSMFIFSGNDSRLRAEKEEKDAATRSSKNVR